MYQPTEDVMDCQKSLTDLPDETLLKIFSSLGLGDLKRVELVCWKFYDVAKNPSLWRKVEVNIHRREKLLSFCSFFSKYNFPLKLKMDFHVDYILNSEDVCAINSLFSKLKQCWCLHVKELDISNIVLPPSVRYFNYFYNSKAIFDPAKQYSSVLNCFRIESLIMIFIWRDADLFNQETLPRVSAAGKQVLEKYKSSLKILHLRPLHCHWIPQISNCTNLKELTVLFGYFEYTRSERFDLKGITKLPHLESLVVDCAFFAKFSEDLNRYGLPKLKNLSLMDSLPCGKDEFDLIRRRMPNLVTLCISGTLNVKSLFKLVNKSKSLKYFCFGGECVCSKDRVYFLNKIYNLSQERRFDCICFCELIYMYTLIDKIDYVRWFKEKFNKELFSCKKCYSETSASLQCSCWPEKHFKFADRFFTRHNTSHLENFPPSDSIDSSDSSDSEND